MQGLVLPYKKLSNLTLALLFLLLQLLTPLVLTLNNRVAAATSTLFSDTFEGSFGAWTDTGNWQIIGAGGGSDGSKARIIGTNIPGSPGIEMSKIMPTTGYENITLDFDYRTDALDAGDSAVVFYTVNGGGSWTQLSSYTTNTGAWVSQSFNISSINSGVNNIAGFGIMFAGIMNASDDQFNVDNVELSGDGITTPGNIPFCHAAGNSGNYVQDAGSASGIVNGHYGPGHQNGNDIIPPFYFQGVEYSQNWDAEGQAIFNNDCEAPNEEPEVDYCDPSQKPGGQSIGQWLSSQNPVPECVDYQVVNQCGLLQVTLTKNETPYSYGFSYSEGVINYNFNTNASSISFPEDYNGGSVDIYFWGVGAERDYFRALGYPFYPDKNGNDGAAEKATVITDCQQNEPENGSITVIKQIDADGNLQTTDDRTFKDDWEFSITDSQSVNETATTNQNGQTDPVDVEPGTYDVSEDATGYEVLAARCSNQSGEWVGDTLENVTVGDDEHITCGFVNTPLSSITIVKDANPNHPTDFNFTISNGERTDQFSLDDDNDITLSNTRTYNNLQPGTYVIEELQNRPAWQLTDIVCNVRVQMQGNAVTVQLAYNQKVTCRFVNQPSGSISGTKYITNADGNTSGAQTGSGWTIRLIQGNTSYLTQTDENGNYQFNFLLPGHYILEELIPINEADKWTQVCGPSPVQLRGGQTAENRDFCNFENGTIGGVKFDDRNGDGQQQDNEPLLPGWIMTLTNLQDNSTQQDTTNQNGVYAFHNLRPGTYRVCETLQQGWVQTFPGSPRNVQCHQVTIDETGEVNRRKFGNRGFGSITVVKRVDSDGDGQIDEEDSTDWTWEIDNGNQAYSTGSTMPQRVWAGEYRISEDQDDDYRLTDLTCTGDGNRIYRLQGYAKVDVSPGEAVNCYFTNTRKTGIISVSKELYPKSDDGLFDLLIDEEVVAEDASDGDWSGFMRYPTGRYDVSEQAGTDTTLDHYDSGYICVANYFPFIVNVGFGTEIDDVNVRENKLVHCTFVNKKKPTITVVKESYPQDDQNFCFNMYRERRYDLRLNENEEVSEEIECDFVLDDANDDDEVINTHSEVVDTGTYTIEESELEGWRLEDIYCRGAHNWYNKGNTVTVELKYGDEAECVFENRKDASVKVTKFNDYDRDGEWDDNEPALPGWDMQLRGNERCYDYNDSALVLEQEILIDEYECEQTYNYDETQTTGENGMTTFEYVKPGVVHYLSEVEQDDWTWSNTYCNYGDSEESEGYSQEDNYYAIYISPYRSSDADPLECFVGNYREGELQLTKTNNQGATSQPGDVVTYTLQVTVPEESDELFDTQVVDLPPEEFEVINGSETANSNMSGNIAVNPSYASPGIWNLGNLSPGEIVTLTYQAIIGDTTSSGVYPDLAYAVAYDDPANTIELFANSADQPFVDTDVTVVRSNDVLANTGQALSWANIVFPVIMLLLSLGLLPRANQKGGRA